MLVTNSLIADSLSLHAEQQLRTTGHVITGLMIDTVFFGDYIKEKDRAVRPAIILGA